RFPAWLGRAGLVGIVGYPRPGQPISDVASGRLAVWHPDSVFPNVLKYLPQWRLRLWHLLKHYGVGLARIRLRRQPMVARERLAYSFCVTGSASTQIQGAGWATGKLPVRIRYPRYLNRHYGQ